MKEENNKPNINEENNETNPLDKFDEIKTKYEETISAKDKEIEELKKKLSAKDKEVDTTIQNLNDEVNTKLEQAEEIKHLQADMNELIQDDLKH